MKFVGSIHGHSPLALSIDLVLAKRQLLDVLFAAGSAQPAADVVVGDPPAELGDHDGRRGAVVNGPSMVILLLRLSLKTAVVGGGCVDIGAATATATAAAATAAATTAAALVAPPVVVPPIVVIVVVVVSPAVIATPIPMVITRVALAVAALTLTLVLAGVMMFMGVGVSIAVEVNVEVGVTHCFDGQLQSVRCVVGNQTARINVRCWNQMARINVLRCCNRMALSKQTCYYDNPERGTAAACSLLSLACQQRKRIGQLLALVLVGTESMPEEVLQPVGSFASSGSRAREVRRK